MNPKSLKVLKPQDSDLRSCGFPLLPKSRPSEALRSILSGLGLRQKKCRLLPVQGVATRARSSSHIVCVQGISRVAAALDQESKDILGPSDANDAVPALATSCPPADVGIAPVANLYGNQSAEEVGVRASARKS